MLFKYIGVVTRQYYGTKRELSQALAVNKVTLTDGGVKTYHKLQKPTAAALAVIIYNAAACEI